MKSRIIMMLFLLLPGAFLFAGGDMEKDNPTVPVSRLYKLDREFSDLAHQLNGRVITMKGFMAPPLKPDANFFVLTRQPNSICPYCATEYDWPDDIVVIYPSDGIVPVSFSQPIVVTGVLEIGVSIDEATGFYSKVRLVDATYTEK